MHQKSYVLLLRGCMQTMSFRSPHQRMFLRVICRRMNNGLCLESSLFLNIGGDDGLVLYICVLIARKMRLVGMLRRISIV